MDRRMNENQKSDNKNKFNNKFGIDRKNQRQNQDVQDGDANIEVSCIRSVVNDIKKIINPNEIILFHRKISNTGEIISFKICLVVETKGDLGNKLDNKLDIEKNIYKNIDSDVPFDVIIYTCDEWDSLKLKKHSFANNIFKRGCFFGEQK